MGQAIQSWVELGIDRQRVADALFAAHVGIVGDTASAVGERQALAATASLFATTVEECAGLEAARIGGAQRLRSALAAGESAAVAELAEALADDDLDLLLPVICPETSQ